METTKINSYVKEVMARIKGDDDKVTAERNYRKATSAVTGQLASLASKKVDAQIKVEEAKEKLQNAKYPTTVIGDISDYIRSIASKQEKLDSAEEELADVESSLKFFEELNTEFNS